MQGLQHIPVTVNPLDYAKGETLVNHRPVATHLKAIKFASSLSPDCKNVFESFGSDQCDAGTLALEQRVSGHSRPMNYFGDGIAPHQLPDTGEDGTSRIVRSRAHFVNCKPASIKSHQVGKCAACVYTKPDHLLLTVAAVKTLKEAISAQPNGSY